MSSGQGGSNDPLPGSINAFDAKTELFHEAMYTSERTPLLQALEQTANDLVRIDTEYRDFLNGNPRESEIEGVRDIYEFNLNVLHADEKVLQEDLQRLMQDQQDERNLRRTEQVGREQRRQEQQRREAERNEGKKNFVNFFSQRGRDGQESFQPPARHTPDELLRMRLEQQAILNDMQNRRMHTFDSTSNDLNEFDLLQKHYKNLN